MRREGRKSEKRRQPKRGKRVEQRQRPDARVDKVVWLIAAFKLLKGLLLLALAVGALTMIHKNVAGVVGQWIRELRFDPDDRHLRRLFVKLSFLDQRKLEELSAGTFLYAGLFLTEGGGLFMRKRWAEYLTIIITSSFIPLEIYEMVESFSLTKTVVIIVNLAAVLYLLLKLRREKRWPFKARNG